MDGGDALTGGCMGLLAECEVFVDVEDSGSKLRKFGFIPFIAM